MHSSNKSTDQHQDQALFFSDVSEDKFDRFAQLTTKIIDRITNMSETVRSFQENLLLLQ